MALLLNSSATAAAVSAGAPALKSYLAGTAVPGTRNLFPTIASTFARHGWANCGTERSQPGHLIFHRTGGAQVEVDWRNGYRRRQLRAELTGDPGEPVRAARRLIREDRKARTRQRRNANQARRARAQWWAPNGLARPGPEPHHGRPWWPPRCRSRQPS